MAQKILFCESGFLKLTPELTQVLQNFGEPIKLDTIKNLAPLAEQLKSTSYEQIRIIILDAESHSTSEIKSFIKDQNILQQTLWVSPNEDFSFSNEDSRFTLITRKDIQQREILQAIVVAFDNNRPSGIKSFLQEGSTIYTQSLTSANNIGTMLDPCNSLTKEHLDKNRALSSWSAINALVADALTLLPAEKISTGARVELQVGADKNIFCSSVRFPMDYTNLSMLYERIVYIPNKAISPWLIARETCNLFEIRAYDENKTVEIAAVFVKKNSEQSGKKPVLFRKLNTIPLEDAEKTSKYKFQIFSALGKKKSATLKNFKNKFSDKIKESTVEAEAAAAEQAKVKGSKDAPETSTKVKGAASEKEKSEMVKGGPADKTATEMLKGGPADKTATEMLKGAAQEKQSAEILKDKNKNTETPTTTIKGAETPAAKAATVPAPAKNTPVAVESGPSLQEIQNTKDPDKKSALYESKIESLRQTLQQREQLVTKLNKEIEEINDPLKRAVVGNVIDKQKEGLQQNISRLETVIKEGEKREKELMSMVDKAVQQKDKYMKDVKSLEEKLSKASQGNNLQVIQLQKQLDEANRQRALLGKKVTELMGSKKAS